MIHRCDRYTDKTPEPDERLEFTVAELCEIIAQAQNYSNVVGKSVCGSRLLFDVVAKKRRGEALATSDRCFVTFKALNAEGEHV